MISGYDLIYTCRLSPEEARDAMRDLVRRFVWPQAVVEKVDDKPHDFFIYTDKKAKKSWDRNGLTEKHGDHMWHFLFSPRQMTWVCNSIEDADVIKFREALKTFRHPAVVGRCLLEKRSNAK
jgi:hypothetical protein